GGGVVPQQNEPQSEDVLVVGPCPPFELRPPHRASEAYSSIASSSTCERISGAIESDRDEVGDSVPGEHLAPSRLKWSSFRDGGQSPWLSLIVRAWRHA